MTFAIGWKPPAEAEGTCIEMSKVPDGEAVEIGVDTAVLDPVVLETAVLLGARPRMLEAYWCYKVPLSWTENGNRHRPPRLLQCR